MRTILHNHLFLCQSSDKLKIFSNSKSPIYNLINWQNYCHNFKGELITNKFSQQNTTNIIPGHQISTTNTKCYCILLLNFGVLKERLPKEIINQWPTMQCINHVLPVDWCLGSITVEAKRIMGKMRKRKRRETEIEQKNDVFMMRWIWWL